MENLQKKSKLDIIAFVAIAIYLFFGNVANHTIYSNMSIVILLIVSFVYIIHKKKIYLNIYFFLYIVYMIYQLFLVLTEIAVNQNATFDVLQTMLINLVILICLYNMLIYTKNVNSFMKLYIIVSAISLGVIMFLLRDSLFAGRLAHAYGEGAVSYYLFGTAVGMTSNSLAFFCAIATLFSTYLYFIEKNKIYLLIDVFFILGVILTGSRKGILVLVLYLVFIINLIYKNKIGLKFLIGILAVSIVWILITRVPVFYDIIGERLIELVNHSLGDASTEGSIIARERFKRYALEWIAEKPWMGYGAGAFSAIYNNVTENNYLEMMVAGGIIGTILYYLYSIPVIYRYVRVKNKDNIIKMLFFILISIFIVEYGSVTYTARNYLFFIIMYFAYLKILKINESEDKSGRDDK